MFSIYMAGGGTGGHLFPGISLAETIKAMQPDVQIKFLVSGKRLDSSLLEDRGFACVKIEQRQLPQHPRQIGEFMLTNVGALWRVIRLMLKDRPEVVVGLGGYASFAAAASAKLCGVPLVLLEQNVIPGKANRALALAADRVFCQWTQAARFFLRRDNLSFAGNPIRRSLKKLSKEVAREKLGLAPGMRTLLVLGGSQGARALNNAMTDAVTDLKNYSDKVQIIHLAGQQDAELVSRSYRDAGIKASVYAFLKEMQFAYSAADLVLCRAGGTTIAELTGIGLPSILVPLPSAAQNHQFANAGALVSTGAAKLVEEKNLDRNTLMSAITELLLDEEELERMGELAKNAGKPGAAREIAESIVVRINRRREIRKTKAFARLLIF